MNLTLNIFSSYILNEKCFYTCIHSILQQGTDELWRIRDDLTIDETGHICLYTPIPIPQRLYHTHNTPRTFILNEDNEMFMVYSRKILRWLSYRGNSVGWEGSNVQCISICVSGLCYSQRPDSHRKFGQIANMHGIMQSATVRTL